MIIDPRAVTIFHKLLAEQTVERRDVIAKEIQSTKERAASRGILESGMTVKALTELCGAELKIRVQLAWDLLQRVLSDVGIKVADQLADELKEIIRSVIDKQADEVFDQFSKSVRGLRVGWSPETIQVQAQMLTESTFARIDLFALSLARATDYSGRVVNNFYGGQFGAVLTGGGANATVTQNISATDQAALLKALGAVDHGIQLAKDIADASRTDLLEVIEEVRVELARTQPNRLRLTQLGTGIALSIQTVASLKPAYGLLKGALLAIGIHVP